MKKDNISLYVSFIALLLATVSFYFQFIYVDKKFYITPMLPVATSGKINYKFIFNNPGGSTVTLSETELTLSRKGGPTEEMKGNITYTNNLPVVFKNPNITSFIPIPSNATYELVFEVDEKKAIIDMSSTAIKDDETDIYFQFEFVDGTGKVEIVRLEACSKLEVYKPSKNITTKTDDSGAIHIPAAYHKINKGTCNVAIGVF